jgi:hypothetical protein
MRAFFRIQKYLFLFWLVSLGLIQTVTMKNFLATAYGTNATHAALYSTVPGASQGTEATGGSPAYARKALVWGAAASGVVSITPVVFDCASGQVVAGAGVHNSATVNTAYLDGTSVTSQTFSSQGTYTLSLSYTQT